MTPPNPQVSSACSNWVGSFILVRPTRFERATYRVGVCHSIQLSYERIFYCPYSITDTRRKVKQKNGGLHFEGKLVQ